MVGDIDNDGAILGSDVVFLASYIAGIDSVVAQAQTIPNFNVLADFNQDGSVNAADVVAMASYIAGLTPAP